MCKLRRIKEIKILASDDAFKLACDVSTCCAYRPVHNIQITESETGYSATLITYEED